MTPRTVDGSAGDTDYSKVSKTYVEYRVADPRIQAHIAEELGLAKTVLNVGAGAGSYEPRDREVTAVEPSETMRSRRPSDLTKAIDATAEALPFPNKSFDASMATFSVHQWKYLARGLDEMRRVTRGPVIILTCDPTLLVKHWTFEYAPEVVEIQAQRYPPIPKIVESLGGETYVRNIPIPLDCSDGFNEAYYGRPELLLQPEIRHASSAWSFVDKRTEDRLISQLQRDLQSGEWDRRYGHLRSQPTLDGSLVLVVSRPADLNLNPSS